MRGELNPLVMVLDGKNCKYCNKNDITKGAWEVDPRTLEVFHVDCKTLNQMRLYESTAVHHSNVVGFVEVFVDNQE